jgi:hypothetical protein
MSLTTLLGTSATIQTVTVCHINVSYLAATPGQSTSTVHQSTDVETNRSFWSTTNEMSVTLGSVGIVTNLFACAVIIRHKPLLKRLPNYFIFNQCVLDLISGCLLVATIAVTYALIPLVTNKSLLYVLCAVFNTRFLFTGAFTASIWNLAALSLERYFEIVHPIRHKLYMTKAKVIQICAGLWLFGLVYKTAIVFPTSQIIDGSCHIGVYSGEIYRRIGGVYISLCEFLMPLGIIAFCYVQMAKAVRKIGIINFSASTRGSRTGASMFRARRNILKILAIVSAAFFMCVSPRQIVVLAYTVGMLQIYFNDAFYLTTLGLNYFNCCINPCIYMFHHEEFHNGVRAIFKSRNSSISHTVVASQRIKKTWGSRQNTVLISSAVYQLQCAPQQRWAQQEID